MASEQALNGMSHGVWRQRYHEPRRALANMNGGGSVTITLRSQYNGYGITYLI